MMVFKKSSMNPTTHRGWVTGALLLSTFMTAIEITIVATAVPRIVAELGGFALLSWIFSAYLLTQVVCIPIYGKLADLFGRKPVFLCGMIVFLAASILCGLSETMVQLIASRFLQGIGGGAVQPIAVTIAGDLYSPHERHRIQGWFGSIFAFSAIAGPALGAFIVDLGHWSWIFYLNVPIGILAFIVLLSFLHEEKQPRKHKIDFAGALFLIISTSSLMLALLQGGTRWQWFGIESISLFISFITFFFILLYWERKHPEPVLPLWIFKHRLIGVAGAATFLNGALMIGYSAFIPSHVQGVLGESPLIAGLAVAGMSFGWPTASFLSGKVMKQMGYRKVAIGGATLVLFGAIAVALVANVSAIAICASMFVVGLGLGFQSNAYIITIQSAVSWKERGVATANNLFMRTLGSSVGVAIFGAILNSSVSSFIKNSNIKLGNTSHGLDLINSLLDPSNTELLGFARETVISSLSKGMIIVFSSAILAAIFGILFSFMLPENVKAREEKVN